MNKRTTPPRPDEIVSAQDRMKRRSFLPKQRDMFLETLRYALRVKSTEDLPKLFQLPVAVALKPGCKDELATRFAVPELATDPRRMAFESAMALYCKSKQYGYALLYCEQLFNIDMDPAGLPGREDRAQGRALVGPPAKKRAHVGPRKTGKVDAPVSDPTAADKSEPAHKVKHPGPRSAVQTKPDSTAVGERQARKPRLTPMQKRTFFPDQRERHRARFCKALGVTEEKLPTFLAEPVAVPLKIGTLHELVKRHDLPKESKTPERRVLHAALSAYCGSFQYQHAILNCETRFTIDMEPDDLIDDGAREFAIQRLRDLARHRKARNERRRDRDGTGN